MEPDQIVGALRRHALLALAHIVVGAIIGFVVALVSTPVYTSHTSALVAADGGGGTRSISSSSTTIMPTVVEIGTSRSVVDQVAASTGIDRDKITGAVELSNKTNSLIVEVTARGSSPQEAQAIAQAEVSALRNVVGDMSVQQQEDVTLTLTDVDAASLPTSPSGPSHTRYALIGAIVGAVLGVVTALLIGRGGSAPDGVGEDAEAPEPARAGGTATYAGVGNKEVGRAPSYASTGDPRRSSRSVMGPPPSYRPSAPRGETRATPLDFNPTGSGDSPTASRRT